MNTPVTIVLPVHNAQNSLRGSLLRMMELAETTGRRLQVAVVDDGSTDATFEVACELASEYPQVHVFRQPYQRGLGAALEQVRNRLGVSDVVAHNGIAEIDHRELASLLASSGGVAAAAPLAVDRNHDAHGSRRTAALPTLNTRLAEAHRSSSSFRWLRIDEAAAPRRQRTKTPVLGAALNGLMPTNFDRAGGGLLGR